MDLETLSRANRLSGEIIDLERELKEAQRLRERSGTLTLSRCNSDIYISDSRLINDILRLTNRLKRKNKLSLKKYIEEYGEDCNTCANALSNSPFIGCDLKVKDFTYQDEVICCRYYEFKGFIEED